MEIVWRTLFDTGSIRTSVPALSVTIQTLSRLAAIPPSGAAGPIESVATIWLVVASTRTIEFGLPHSGTHRLPKPNVRPEHGSPGTLTMATSLLVLGSILWTEAGSELATQTASSVICTQSASVP